MKETYVRLANRLEGVDASCVALADLHNFAK